MTSGYENVNIIDMDNSWRDGLAFCAMIHHFRPNLIVYDSLKTEDVLKNNELAFKIAEQEMGIPSLLDPQVCFLFILECNILSSLFRIW